MGSRKGVRDLGEGHDRDFRRMCRCRWIGFTVALGEAERPDVGVPPRMPRVGYLPHPQVNRYVHRKGATPVRVVPVSSPLEGAPITEEDLARLEDDDLEAYPLVLVVWHDAFFEFDQASPDDCRSDYLVRTVGFLVHEGPRFVSVAQEVLPEGEGFRAVTHIPRSIVESIETLHPGPTAVASGEVG